MFLILFNISSAFATTTQNSKLKFGSDTPVAANFNVNTALWNSWKLEDKDKYDIYSIYKNALITEQIARTINYKDAADFLAKYLRNEGGTLDINVKTFINRCTGMRWHLNDEINKAASFAESNINTDNKSYSFTSNGVNVIVPYGDPFINANFENALGTFRTWTQGDITKVGNSYYMNLTIYVRDVYAFDINTIFMPAGYRVTDKDLAKLERYGLAKPFLVKGSHTVSVKWQKGQRFTKNPFDKEPVVSGL